MANEITKTVQISVLNGEYDMPRTGEQSTLTQTTAGFGPPGMVSVGLSVEQISFGDITPGMVYVKNCDSTNFITYGCSSGSLGFKVRATDQATFEMATGGTLWMQADSGTCKVIVVGVNL